MEGNEVNDFFEYLPLDIPKVKTSNVTSASGHLTPSD